LFFDLGANFFVEIKCINNNVSPDEGDMLGNYEGKIAGDQEVFNQILESVSGELQNKEIHEVKEELFRSVLKPGHSLLGTFIEKKGSGKDIKTDIPYHRACPKIS